MDFSQNPWEYRPEESPKTQDFAPVLPKSGTGVNFVKAPVSLGAEIVRGYELPQNRDGSALGKMGLIRDKVVKPALEGPGLIYTRELLGEILRGVSANANGHKAGQWALAQRIFSWVRSRVRYVLDPKGKELFQALPVTIKQGIGDCDDFTGAIAALCKAAGLRVCARCVTLKPSGPYVHIYPCVLIGQRWIALDATENHPPGWEARHALQLDLEL